MISVLMTTCWRVVGYGMMIYMAAMKGISPQYYEASAIDGANKTQHQRGANADEEVSEGNSVGIEQAGESKIKHDVFLCFPKDSV
jgi:hypothetical protein